MPLDILAGVQSNGFQSDLGLDKSRTIFPITEMALGAHTITHSENGETTHIGGETEAISSTHKAIVRTDTRDIVGIVSQSYRPLENRSLFSSIETAMREVIPEDMMVDMQVRESMTGGGSWSKREYILPAYAREVGNSDHRTNIGLRLIAWNSYDGSASAGLVTGLIDFYCTNGMVVGKNISKDMRRHTTRLTAQAFIPGLRRNVEDINRDVGVVQSMLDTPLDIDAALTLLEKQFSARRAAQIHARTQREIEERGPSLFAFYSALTHYASHDTNEYSKRSSDDGSARMLAGREDHITRVVASQQFQSLISA